MPRTANAFHAAQLLRRWTDLARRHFTLGAACACGRGFAGLRLLDFEQQLLDHLRTRHGAAVIGTSISEVLRGFAATESAVPRAAQKALLADFERSLDSFDELHGFNPAAGSPRL